MSARAIELTSEESLIYVNLWLLVCQVVDQRHFTVGVEGGLWELFFFFFFFKQTWLACIGAQPSPSPPPLWMFESAIQLQCANRWHSDKWWLGVIVGFSSCTWVSLGGARETRCLGQLMFLWAKGIQLLSCVRSCACVWAHFCLLSKHSKCTVCSYSIAPLRPSVHFLFLLLQADRGSARSGWCTIREKRLSSFSSCVFSIMLSDYTGHQQTPSANVSP